MLIFTKEEKKIKKQENYKIEIYFYLFFKNKNKLWTTKQTQKYKCTT